jgi:hypothetical protein
VCQLTRICAFKKYKYKKKENKYYYQQKIRFYSSLQFEFGLNALNAKFLAF